MPELVWLGDRDAKRAARRVPYRLLQPISTVGDPAADNLLIQGDNLEALKALLPFYAGRVKCIYIWRSVLERGCARETRHRQSLGGGERRQVPVRHGHRREDGRQTAAGTVERRSEELGVPVGG